MIFVKEDLILPLNLTFYELIASKARGKSGPLFDFEVRDDVRLVNDARVEVETSHPGKVMTRSFYNANRHSFPCSRFEEFVARSIWQNDSFLLWRADTMTLSLQEASNGNTRSADSLQFSQLRSALICFASGCSGCWAINSLSRRIFRR